MGSPPKTADQIAFQNKIILKIQLIGAKLSCGMEDQLKSNLSKIKFIGEKLNRVETKIPAFKQHLQELETNYKKVSNQFDDMFTAHEKTFLSVRRNLENANDKTIGELEMKMMHPMKHQKYLIETKSENNGSSCRHHYSRDIARMNPELPSFVSDKYKQRKLMNVDEVRAARYLHEAMHPRDMSWMSSISRSAELFSSDSCRKAILDSLNMAWTQDKFKNVEDKYNMKHQCE